MKCLFYDKTLNKKIPCILVPNKLYIKEGDRFCKVTYDDTLFVEYSTNFNELNRYSTDNIDIFDIYPANTVEEIAYANACIPNNTTVNHKYDELIRFEKIVTMLTNVETIRTDFFYKLADFLSYDLLFFYLNQAERMIMLTICTYLIPLENVAMLMIDGVIPVKPYLRTIKRIFDKYPEDNTVKYYVQNIRNLAEFYYISFPLELNIPYLKTNVNMLYDNNYLID
jgi:hypothetical protein